jgi:hypothetical protein
MIDVGQFRRSHTFPDAWAIPTQCLPGRIAVVMDEPIEGVVIVNKEPCTGVVVDSNCEGIDIGDRVIVFPEHGLQMDYRDAGWIPCGADLRLYGVHVPASDSVIAVLTNSTL